MYHNNSHFPFNDGLFKKEWKKGLKKKKKKELDSEIAVACEGEMTQMFWEGTQTALPCWLGRR